MHDCPPTRRNFIATAPSSAAWKSASSKTMNGALPPSSNESRVTCWAAVCMIPLPTSVGGSALGEHPLAVNVHALDVCHVDPSVSIMGARRPSRRRGAYACGLLHVDALRHGTGDGWRP